MSMNSTITDINNTNKPNISHTHRISSGSQACAACKYQRRKCAPDCILSPYFPHDKQRQFLNAHKLFGVRNITKIIQDMSPRDKDIAMETIIFQSDMRAKDPVGGVYRIIKTLETECKLYKAEFDLVCQQIAMCRAHQAAAYHHQQQQQHSFIWTICYGCSEMMLKAENLVLEDETEAFQQHQIPEHDLRSAANLFTLTS